MAMGMMYDRILLFLSSVAAAFVSVVAVGLTFGWVGRGQASAWLNALYNEPLIRGICAAAAVMALLISLRLIYLSVRAGRDRFPSINQRNAYGDVRISYEAVHHLALQAAGRIKGLQETRARVRAAEKGLEIELSTLADGDTSIPALSEETQRSVKSHIEEMTGIPVAGVSVYIRNVGTSSPPVFKNRVE